jgi:hypothetical protein
VIAAMGSMSGTAWGAVLAMGVALGVAGGIFATLYFTKSDGATVDRMDDRAQAEFNAMYDLEPTPNDEKQQPFRSAWLAIDAFRKLTDRRKAGLIPAQEVAEAAQAVESADASVEAAADVEPEQVAPEPWDSLVETRASAPEEIRWTLSSGATGMVLKLTDEVEAEIARARAAAGAR